jgi:hypothetical protein
MEKGEIVGVARLELNSLLAKRWARAPVALSLYTSDPKIHYSDPTQFNCFFP